MKNYKTIVFAIFIICSQSVIHSQNITTGICSGMNFSDIHGQDIGGKWESKLGPVQGLSLGYSFSRSIGIQTGINFSTVYYQHKSTYYPAVIYPLEFYDINPIYYYQADEKMNFSFLRVPLLLTISIPSAVQFNLKAGLFFSFAMDHSLNPGYYYTSTPDNVKKKDFGYMFSSGVSYPLNENTKVAFNVSYLTGRIQFIENSSFRHGSSEFTIGIDYDFLKKTNKNSNSKTAVDSSSSKVTITYTGGLNYSWNSNEAGLEKYSYSIGPSLGFSINFPVTKGIAFISGVSFERKGYSMKDSSILFYRYIKSGTPKYYVNSKVQIDYAVIPFLLSIQMGNSQRVFFNTGPWLGLKLNARNVGVAYNESRSESNFAIRKTVIYDDIEKLIKDDDIGWIFGGGVSLPVFHNYNVVMSLQYSSGFKNVFNKDLLTNPQSTSAGDFEIRNRTISFLIGLTIPPSRH